MRRGGSEVGRDRPLRLCGEKMRDGRTGSRTYEAAVQANVTAMGCSMYYGCIIYSRGVQYYNSMVVEYRTDLSAVDSLQDWQEVRVHSGLTPPHMACHVPDPQSGL